MIKKTPSAASPDAYVAAFDGWRRKAIEALHSAVRAAAKLEEVIKWGSPGLLLQRTRAARSRTAVTKRGATRNARRRPAVTRAVR